MTDQPIPDNLVAGGPIWLEWDEPGAGTLHVGTAAITVQAVTDWSDPWQPKVDPAALAFLDSMPRLLQECDAALEVARELEAERDEARVERDQYLDDWRTARREVLRLQHVETERDTLAEALGRALEHCLGWHGSCCPCNEDWCMDDARAVLTQLQGGENDE